ncbi:type I-E CRISPR-associated protein Cas5/CasD [Candidatus Endoriftia persephonae]|jgi:CRISPR system Cascade subunit CasD|uniref:CRISPR-associated protein, CT1976 family n=2 Tax=Gammaproteobacteria TaxID=1236 RepID=G2FJU4_9GAMM|nr:type I-E CRISPR-associated protein Cas5/CasD [Candidatus Endoriftia persephone]EGW52931.1 CRISPR-associated protein, CT1976 family [endosymbiont of Tevnia jerichonana (vent Tica)]USF87093.1 type I-E CRISPR-associated protein Cas5/CasD [Candidatus Endoriftia persephone]
MADYLLFRLYGPMAAWGDTAVGEFRPSHGHPTRTGVLGLVAAALGITRDNEAQLLALDRGCRIAVRLDAPGELLRDYHTTQVPPQQRKGRHYTRRDELNADKLHTILSQRDYRTDTAASIALSLGTDAKISLDRIKHALQRPALPLYLGRKSCPLALPLAPEIIIADSLSSAFAAYPDSLAQLNEITQESRAYGDGLPRPDLIRFFWEESEPTPGMQTEMIYPRRDCLRSRRRWQFDPRNECYAAQPVKEDNS